ncbi:MAG: molybdenum cofactor guanylyltransferase [Nitrospirota bacterium]|nr:molybdenum cofactor guanylyltransferase [Nitrospirota bacterium]
MIGVILAGGENSRMGSDKAFLEVEGKPLIEHILAVHGSLFTQTIIVTRTPQIFRSYPVVVAEDAFDIRGPLTGIYSGIRSSCEDLHFVSACDMPYLNVPLITYLQDQVGDYDAVVPRIQGLSEPLHAIYHRRLLPVMESFLKNGERKIQRLFDGANVRFVAEDEIDRFDPRHRSFVNINTPEEYKEVVCSDWACRN